MSNDKSAVLRGLEILGFGADGSQTQGEQTTGQQDLTQGFAPTDNGGGNSGGQGGQQTQTSSQTTNQGGNQAGEKSTQNTTQNANAGNQTAQGGDANTQTQQQAVTFEAYTLERPQDVPLSDDDVKSVQQLLNENKIPKEVGTKLFEKMVTASKTATDSVKSAVAKVQTDWAREAQQDPEIMENLPANQEIVRRYLAEQPEGFVEVVKKAGLLNNREVIKYFMARGRQMQDGRTTGMGGSGSAGQEASAEEYAKSVYAGKM